MTDKVANSQSQSALMGVPEEGRNNNDESAASGSFFSRWSQKKKSADNASDGLEQTLLPEGGENSDGHLRHDVANRESNVGLAYPPASRTGRMITDPPADQIIARDASLERTSTDTGISAAADQAVDSPCADSPKNEVDVEEQSRINELQLTDADMPDLNTLGPDSDYSEFFGKGISKDLRQQALARLFSMPKFNIRDGLNDYDEDYTVFEPLGDTVTSDMKWHTARKLREEEERKAAERQAELLGENGQPVDASSEDSKPDAIASDSIEADADASPESIAAAAEPQHGELEERVSLDLSSEHHERVDALTSENRAPLLDSPLLDTRLSDTHSSDTHSSESPSITGSQGTEPGSNPTKPQAPSSATVGMTTQADDSSGDRA